MKAWKLTVAEGPNEEDLDLVKVAIDAADTNPGSLTLRCVARLMFRARARRRRKLARRCLALKSVQEVHQGPASKLFSGAA